MLNLTKMIKRILGWKEFEIEKEYVLPGSSTKKCQNEVAIVTGGSGGIGRAISIRLSIEGAVVYVAGRNVEKLRSIVNEIKELGGEAKCLELDVANEDSIQKSFEEVYNENNGKLDILVNCAGGSPRERAKNFFEQDIGIIDEMLVTNLRGSLLCSRMASKIMVKQKKGKIINIASVLGTNGQAKQTEYTAAKAGIIGYTKALAIELGKYGITVNCISPGLVPRGTVDADMILDLKRKNVLNKVGTQEQIAEAVTFLISKEADFITGQNLIVDGGWSLGVRGEE